MKKNIFVILLAFCMSFSLLAVPSAAVSSSEDSGVVQTVRALGIIQGDANGSLNLSSNVTRAQFAKMLVAASSYHDSVGEGTGSSLYKDVKSTYWASKYIKVAVDQGWMLGYIDGSFRPEKSITIEEACTSALRVLGYDSSSFTGAYPWAQLSKAGTLGLRDQISLTQGGIMSRGDCAFLFYNLMTAQDSSGKAYGATLGYTITNGQLDYASIIQANLSGPYISDGDTPVIPFSGNNITVYRDGVISSLTAINQYDIYYYNTGLRTIWIYTDRTAGTITNISPSTATPTTVTVGGNTYTIGTANAAYKLSALGSFKVGDTALLLLGMDGSVVDVVSGSAADTVYYGIIVGSEKGSSISGNATVQISVRVACTDGQERTFTVNSGSYSVGTIVSANITSEGTSVTALGAKGIVGKVDSDKMTLGSTPIASNVQIIDTSSDGGYVHLYLSRLSGITLSSSNIYYYNLNEKGEISHLILRDATGDLWTYCYITTAEVNTSGSYSSGNYVYMLNGSKKTLPSGALYPVQTGGAAIRFNSDGSIHDIKNISSTAISDLNSLYAMNGSQKFLLDTSVQVYLKKNDAYYVTTLSAINTTSYTLTGWYDNFGYPAGGRMRVIVAEAK